MEFAAELQAILREFIASGVVEVRENGGRVAPFSGMSWEVRGNGEKPLLHLWSDQLNLTRRVLAITDRSEQRLALAVERFGRVKPDRLEFIRREFERGARELSREEFRERLTHLLAEQFPDETFGSLVTSPDHRRAHHSPQEILGHRRAPSRRARPATRRGALVARSPALAERRDRYGYFQGVALQQVPPLVYLVAPALRFHPATDDLLKYL
jgi:hypothetical protein